MRLLHACRPASLLTLQNASASLSVDPAFGARVVSFMDKRAGRDWLAPGASLGAWGDDAVYGAQEAAGWDECCPTISPCDARDTAWGRTLRDHGDLWGRPWRVEASRTTLDARFEAPNFTFDRSLALEGPTLVAAYAVTNTGRVTLPLMWSQHALLAVRPGDLITLPGVERLDTTHFSSDGRLWTIPTVTWPDPQLVLAPGRLDHVAGADARFMGKFYAPVAGAFQATIGNAAARLEIAWNAADLPYVGLWLNYGGWPGGGTVTHHIAVEPTTAPADSLADAMAAGLETRLLPGQTRRWSVTLRLRSGSTEPSGPLDQRPFTMTNPVVAGRNRRWRELL